MRQTKISKVLRCTLCSRFKSLFMEQTSKPIDYESTCCTFQYFLGNVSVCASGWNCFHREQLSVCTGSKRHSLGNTHTHKHVVQCKTFANICEPFSHIHTQTRQGSVFVTPFFIVHPIVLEGSFLAPNSIKHVKQRTRHRIRDDLKITNMQDVRKNSWSVAKAIKGSN